jgi:hypothetical protein
MNFYDDVDSARVLAGEMKASAQDRRFAAMRIVHAYADALWTEPGAEYIYTNTSESRAKIAGFIRRLSTMGRTDRWRNAIESWARVVEDESDFQWGFMQYSIYAGHANQ